MFKVFRFSVVSKRCDALIIHCTHMHICLLQYYTSVAGGYVCFYCYPFRKKKIKIKYFKITLKNIIRRELLRVNCTSHCLFHARSLYIIWRHFCQINICIHGSMKEFRVGFPRNSYSDTKNRIRIQKMSE